MSSNSPNSANGEVFGPGPIERFTALVTRWVGSVYAFGLALAVVVVWGVTGPMFNYSDTWQLVINTGTTIVTFLMVFLIQRAQNKDTLALHLKLNELIAAARGASNRLIDAEDLPEDEVRRLHDRYRRLAERILDETDPSRPHSVEEDARRKQAAHGQANGAKSPRGKAAKKSRGKRP